MSDKYFALKEASEVAGILLRRSETFYNHMKQNDYLDKVRKCWMFYHGIFNDAGYNNHEVTFAGEQGEYSKLPANHFRNLAEHIIRMLTANRPTMDARAVNTDAKSLSQAYLANGILDYYMREKHLESTLTKALEMAVVMGVGYIKMDWNSTGGDVYDYDEEAGTFDYEGEIEFSNLSINDVVFDGTKENWNHDWMVVRTWQNKYNLMAKYPELADQIQPLKTKSDAYMTSLRFWSNDDTEDIPVYEFYHKRTEAVPDGRYLLFLDGDIVLLDTKMPYRQIPIFRVVPSEILGTCYGYSPMFDIYPLQEAINVLYSSLFTNQAAFGVHNIYVPPNSNITSSQLDGGLNILEGNAPPQPINLLSSSPELFKALELYIETAETLSGVNSVARGNPEASLRSGSALALVQSMALQFVSGLQKNYVKMIEDVGTALINTLKDFANAPKVVALVGKNNKTYLKEFTGEDIANISRVMVDVGNPLARSVAGRVQMAEQMMQMKLLKHPQQYFQIIETGKLQVAYEGEEAELLLIKSENEKMMEGIQVPALIIDQHLNHINEHKSLLADTDLRNDPKIRQVVLMHIQEHIDILRNGDPALLQLIGETPLPPPAPAGLQQEGLRDPNVPMKSVQNSTMDETLASPQIPSEGGDKLIGPGNPENQNPVQSLPNIPKPAGEFKNLPVLSKDMI